jgi:hypothetical protein
MPIPPAMPRRVLPLLLLATALPAPAQSTSVLFIGNSYVGTNDLPNMFRQLALSLGDTVTVASVAPGGYTLYQHATYAPRSTPSPHSTGITWCCRSRASWAPCLPM